jgi:hypothetical protein
MKTSIIWLVASLVAAPAFGQSVNTPSFAAGGVGFIYNQRPT